MADVTISEVRLKTLIKEIFKEEFENQQKNLLDLISWSFDVTMTEIKKVQSDVNELKPLSGCGFKSRCILIYRTCFEQGVP